MITVNFEGKLAAVTCGSSGLGFAAASALAQAGAHVYVMGRRPEELISAVEDWTERNGRAGVTCRLRLTSIVFTLKSRQRKVSSRS